MPVRSLALHLLLLKAVADSVYIWYLSPAFSYAGFDVELNIYKYLVSVLITFLLGMTLSGRVRRPSDFLLAIVVTFIVMPILSIWALRDQSSLFVLYVLAGLMLTYCIVRFPLLRLPRLFGGYRMFFAVIALISITYLYFYITRGGLAFVSLDLKKVYQSREVFEQQVLGDWVVYIARWFSKIAIVAGIAVALARRSQVMFIVFFLLGIASFFMTTTREQLVYPLVPVGMFLLCRFGSSPSRWMVGTLTFVIAVGAVIYAALGSIGILSFSALRAFFAIGQNQFLYFEFFSDNEFILFSQNILSWLVEYPYQEPVPVIIGEGRFGGADTFSNAGLYAAGYMQAGLLGLLAYSAITGFVIRMVDSFVERQLPLHVGLSIGFVAVYQLSNIDLLTALLTQGVAFALLLLYLLSGSRQAWNSERAGYER